MKGLTMTILYADHNVYAVIPDNDDYDPSAWVPTNCKYCGARLEAGQIICDYCNQSRSLKKEILNDH